MRIVWSDRAVHHLETIHEHIAEDSPAAARRVLARLIEAPERHTYCSNHPTESARSGLRRFRK